MLRPPHHRRPRIARRALPVLIVAVVALLCIGGFTVFAAIQSDLSIAPSPSSQTVSAGQTATYTVTIKRLGGLTGPVALAVAGLPTGTSAAVDGPTGTSFTVPADVNVVTLQLKTSSVTPAKTSYPVVTATSGSVRSTTALTLAVQTATTANFTLAATPAARSAVQGETAAYTIAVSRAGGFTGPVQLAALGAPDGVTRQWRLPDGTVSTTGVVPAGVPSATLEIATGRDAAPGAYELVIVGTGKPGTTQVTRFAAVTLALEPSLSFRVSGDLPGVLAPGVRTPLDLRLTNPYSFDLKVTGLAVGLEEATSRAGCSGTENFRVIPPRAGTFVLRGRAAGVPLSSLVGAAGLPAVEMLDTPVSQDACTDAAVTLQYSGTASR